MGEEALERTDCRAKILSQDYRDFLIPGYREDIEVRLPEEKTLWLSCDPQMLRSS